jgi:hypothetical protein
MWGRDKNNNKKVEVYQFDNNLIITWYQFKKKECIILVKLIFKFQFYDHLISLWKGNW